MTEGAGETTKHPEYALKTQMVLDAVLESAKNGRSWVEMEGALQGVGGGGLRWIRTGPDRASQYVCYLVRGLDLN